jgi:cation transport protein ChaC
MTGGAEDLWVFGYGSLMWRPGFPFVERHHGRLHGYHRALCVLSHVHRGRPDRPGLVLGLDRGGRCRGVVFRVAGSEWDATLHYLREREQVTAVYLERWLPVEVEGGRRVRAVGYVVDRRHPQYAKGITYDQILALVRQGQGVSGANADYVRSTDEHLMAMGVIDPLLRRLTRALDPESR